MYSKLGPFTNYLAHYLATEHTLRITDTCHLDFRACGERRIHISNKPHQLPYGGPLRENAQKTKPFTSLVC